MNLVLAKQKICHCQRAIYKVDIPVAVDSQYHLSMLLRLVHFIFFTRIKIDIMNLVRAKQKICHCQRAIYKVDIPMAMDSQRVLA